MHSSSSGSDSAPFVLGEVGEFKDKFFRSNDVEGLDAIIVDKTSAPGRLLALKRKFNELQIKRSTMHRRQGANVALRVVIPTPFSLVSGAASALKQKKRIDDILKQMKECINQINALRAAFGDIKNWAIVEGQCIIDEKAFNKEALDRKLLIGSL